MSFVSLLFGLGGQQSTLGTLTLDVLLSEDTNLTSNLSRYPVEEGAPTSDNITIENEKLSISGRVVGAGVLLFQGLGPSKLIAAKATLRQLYRARVPITVVTGGDLYENRVITSLHIGRSGAKEALTIDAELEEMRIVTTRTADIPPEKTKPSVKGKAGATKSNGGKVTPSAEGNYVKQSTLDAWINGKQQIPNTGAAP